jgi:polyhydroxybutyrate depolymerase
MTCLWLLVACGLTADPQPVALQWTIEGVQRQALVFAPPSAKDRTADTPQPAELLPLVFAFHGHGGNMQTAARSFALHRHWPEALVVYMQGLPTPTRADPQGKRNGWQRMQGDQGDRDLKFFDAVLERMKKEYRADPGRLYATGHSNGGYFTYLLWSARPDTFAAVAPSAAGGARVHSGFRPCPCLHIAGRNDELVPFENQQRNMDAVRSINGCVEQGRAWAEGCLIYDSDKGAPFVSFIHPGGHKYPSEAPELIVKFFKEHRQSQNGQAPREAPQQP